MTLLHFRVPAPTVQWSPIYSHTRSPGAAYDPIEVVPAKKDHTLPVAPRVALHPEGAFHIGLGILQSWERCWRCQRFACTKSCAQHALHGSICTIIFVIEGHEYVLIGPVGLFARDYLPEPAKFCLSWP